MNIRKIIKSCAVLSFPFHFNSSIWHKSIKANCYEYLLDLKLGDSSGQLLVGNFSNITINRIISNYELLYVLHEDLNIIGYNLTEEVPATNCMEVFISRSRCGDYHFYRKDISDLWSHKLSFELPTQNDFTGNTITLPEIACSSDTPVGYFYYFFF